MRIGQVELAALPYMPGTVPAPMVQLRLTLLILQKHVDCTPGQARELAAELLQAASDAEAPAPGRAAMQ